MTNILIPTDFCAQSLISATDQLKRKGHKNFNLVLFHAFELPDSPFDLMGYGYKDPSCDLMTEEFRQACKLVKDENPKIIGKIMVRTMKSSMPAVFRNFIDAHDIDLVFCPSDYFYHPVHKKSVDPLPLFSRCGIPVSKPEYAKEEALSDPAFSPYRLSTR